MPTLHASDLGSAKALRKFKAGQRVAGKVLSIDPTAKRVTLTLKPSVVGSKLAPITSLQVGQGRQAGRSSRTTRSAAKPGGIRVAWQRSRPGQRSFGNGCTLPS